MLCNAPPKVTPDTVYITEIALPTPENPRASERAIFIPEAANLWRFDILGETQRITARMLERLLLTAYLRGADVVAAPMREIHRNAKQLTEAA